ncbi:KCTD2_5_17 [Lepeophtheirus salmonis]|uniref:KCTD2_5_17 n=1 Tax=Lepeophtheirus salmonis TaxID=72036 RepID=A0A7R8CZC4_LEPSM|nr:KCTD2_5_17 [Lepeophtheirus salmonis]CAF2974878.1 KCTD2_5_17 [Lepeophtheirus salmonis]
MVIVCFLTVMMKHGYIGEFEVVDDHRGGKIVVNLTGRLNKCGVISPRFDVGIKDIEKWTNNLLPSRQFGYIHLLFPEWHRFQKPKFQTSIYPYLSSFVAPDAREYFFNNILLCDIDKKKNKCSEYTDSDKMINDSPEWIHFNVGGTLFATTKTTVDRDPKSFLSRLHRISEELPSIQDKNGAYLIDRDPHYFAPVLNFLRHGKLVLDKNISEEGVLEEAEFYNVSSLIKLIKERIHIRDIQKKETKGKHVYRLLQCHEEELTQMISTLSDGWKLVQVINTGPGYRYGTDDHGGEYYCIVSREYPVDSNILETESTDRAKVLQKNGIQMKFAY